MDRLVGFAFVAIVAMVALMPRGGGGSFSATPDTPRAAVVERADDSAAGGAVVLERAADSHFYADAEVNGEDVRFLVDSGASDVVLTLDDAETAGIDTRDDAFVGRAATANGETRFMPVRIERLRIGKLEARGVRAAVIEEGLGVSLLGQSFLERVGKVEIEGDEMRLK